MSDFVSQLFSIKPIQWGLRGDPHLWDEMQLHFDIVQMPDSRKALSALLEEAFFSLTGTKLAVADMVRVDRFPKYGMSGGIISGEFWRETGIPLLLGYYDDK